MTAEHIFYDGECGVCHWAVSLAGRHDKDGSAFRFAPLGGETFAALLTEEQRTGLPDSLVVRTADGRILLRSSGVVHVLRRLGGAWRFLGHLLWLVPRPLRDLGYDLLAAVRKKIVRQPEGLCPMVPPEIGQRFDP